MRQEIAPSLKEAGWKCNRCQAENLALRDKCYKCSGPISEKQLDVLRETREELRATGGSIPQRTVKRGGTISVKEQVNPERLIAAPELRRVQQRVLLEERVVLAVILSFRRITRSQNPMTESGLGLDGRTTIVGMNGMEATESGKIVVEIVKAGTTTMMITTMMADRVEIAKAGTITTKTVTRTTTRIVDGIITKKMTVQDGEIGVIKTIKTMSGMVGRAGVADVDCLAKVRWLTQ